MHRRPSSSRRAPSPGPLRRSLRGPTRDPPSRSGDREDRLLVPAGGADAHPGGDDPCQLGQRLGRGTGFALSDRRDADIAALANGHVEGDAAQVLEPVLLGESFTATASEDLGDFAAVPADEAGHVLDQPDHGDTQPLHHCERLADVGQGDLLGRGDEDGTADRHGLGERQLGIGGARRQIDHEVVEIAPLHVAEELLDGAADERAAPDDRLTLRDEELDRDDLDPVPFEGRDPVVRARLRLTVDPQHHRDVGSGDVGVEEADRCARLGQRHGKVDADRGLPDPALARGHRDDVLDPGNELLGLAGRRAADHGSPGDVDPPDAEGGHLRPHVRLDLVLERAGRGGQLDRERDVGPVDLQVLDHVPGHEVAAKLGLLDLAQDVHDGGLGERHVWGRPSNF